MATESQHIIEKLSNIESDLDYIKKHMASVDSILTDDDIESLEEADRDLAKGRTKRI